ncbi:MAG: class I SAM-dependent methyltransferase [Planctomycetota bacterium]|nr:MAG: class I SAM-dependent methyltransferase [Planctomycetota bacterium]
MARKRKKKKKGAKKDGLTAATADKHELYEKSVQEPEADIEFIDKVFRKLGKPLPMSLREDFCGTAVFCAEWVKSHKKRTAVGLDLDLKTLNYGMERHIKPLGEAAERVQLLCRNVLQGSTDKVDVLVAFNFSYWCFMTRREMLQYFRKAREGVKDQGLFVLDIYGGPDAQVEVEEIQEKDGFEYVWDQGPMDAISHQAKRWIHFRFPDGTEQHKAFSYEWRIWSLPELSEVLLDAGFDRVDVYWEGSDKGGEGNGIFKKTRRAENEEAWIAYLVATPGIVPDQD